MLARCLHGGRDHMLMCCFCNWCSGLKFVLNTDEAVGDLREHMHYVYSSIFVEYVTKNPLYEPGRPFK
jgi:trafficking protein particle complex subunit 1